MLTPDTTPLDATGIADQVRRREVSPVEAVEEALERIERDDGDIGAHTIVFAERALDDARRLEVDPQGPLCGVPFTVKDVTWVAGAPATNGSRALEEFVAPQDAIVVERMRAAGAVLVAKTNNPEFCLRGVTENDVYGVTRNPHDRTRTPGGSSGGAGAAVAAGTTPIALGSDGGGSIRIPASFCGVAGLKPTFGLVPDGPGFAGWPTLTVNGPLARTVRDLRLCAEVLVGPHPADPATVEAPPPPPAYGTPRLAYSADLGSAPVEPDVRAAFQDAVERLAEAGWRAEVAAPPTPDPNDLWTRIAVMEGYASTRALITSKRDRITADSLELLEAGAHYSAADYLGAARERAAYASEWARFFEAHDLLLCPTMQTTALPLGIKSPTHIDGQLIDPFFDDWCSFCLPANLTGQPAVTVPCGLDRDGLPIGLQIIAPRFREDLALGLAAAWEGIVSDQGATTTWQ